MSNLQHNQQFVLNLYPALGVRVAIDATSADDAVEQLRRLWHTITGGLDHLPDGLLVVESNGEEVACHELGVDDEDQVQDFNEQLRVLHGLAAITGAVKRAMETHTPPVNPKHLH